jgi:translation initiation factor IF-1
MTEKGIVFNGKITEILPYGNYKVKLENELEILSNLSGKMKQLHIRIFKGDNVEIKMNEYDMSKGQIVSKVR